jgi:hypothetical protein
MDSYSCSLVAFWTNQHNVRNINRTLKFDNTWRKTSALGLNLALMLFAHAHALYSDSTSFWGHFNHFTTSAFIVIATADYFNRIAFLNFCFHFNLLLLASLALESLRRQRNDFHKTFFTEFSGDRTKNTRALGIDTITIKDHCSIIVESYV